MIWTELFFLAVLFQVTLAKPLYKSVNTFQNAEVDDQTEGEFVESQQPIDNVRGIVKKFGETVGSAANTSADIADKTVETADKGINKGFKKLSQLSSAALHLPLNIGSQIHKHAVVFAEGFKDGYSKTQQS